MSFKIIIIIILKDMLIGPWLEKDIEFSSFPNKPCFNFSGSVTAPTRSHLIGDHPSGLTKEQTRETMDYWQLGSGFCFRVRVLF